MQCHFFVVSLHTPFRIPFFFWTNMCSFQIVSQFDGDNAVVLERTCKHTSLIEVYKKYRTQRRPQNSILCGHSMTSIYYTYTVQKCD